MGAAWVPVRKAAHDGTLGAPIQGARDVAERWEQFTDYLALSFSAGAWRGRGRSERPRKRTAAERVEARREEALAETGTIEGSF